MNRQTTLLLASAALASTSTFGAGASAQTYIGQNFGASQYFNDSNFRPPDSNGAVGVDHYVQMINGRYSVYRKSDRALLQTSTLNEFWADVNPLPLNTIDPRILYDPHAQRWYAAGIDGVSNQVGSANNFLFAVSNSADPTAGWRRFKIDSDSNDDRWADYPMMGYNRDAIVLSGNMFFVGQPGGQTTTVVVIPKSDVLSPTPTVANATKFEEFSVNTTGFTLQPAVDLDNGSLPLPLLSSYNSIQMKRSSVSGTPANPLIDTTGGFIPIGNNLAAPDADQPGPKANIEVDSLGFRFYQNPVLNNGELWAVHTVNVNGRGALRWYRINASTNALIEDGLISDPSMAYLYPSIAVNDLGDVVIGMSGTAPETVADPDGTFVSAFAAVGKTVGGVTTFGTPFITREGVSDYEVMDNQARNRWGDYSSTTNDPADPSIFWTIQEYVHATNIWGTQVTEIITPQPGEVRWKDAASGTYGAGTNWFGGAAPTSTSHVIFSRATTPGGLGYTVTFAADQVVDRLSVRQGRVTLDLAGTTLTATNPSGATPGLAVGEFGGAPTLNIVGGTVIADHATLAASPTASAFLNLTGGAKLQLQCNAVGGTDTAPGGEAVLNIDGGSTLQAAQELRVWDRGVVNFNSGILSTALLNVTGGRVNVAASGGAKVVRTTAVQTSNGGRIDLTTNALTVDYSPADGSPLASVREQITGAYNGGAWDGAGIATSHGNASQFGLGYGEASALTNIPPIFGSVDGTTVLVRHTRYGDASLDGLVNLDDFNRLAASFGSTGATWTQGDFTYDARVNLDDFNRLAANFGLAAAASGPTPADWSALASAVPEPGAAGVAVVLAAGATGMMSRRRGRAARSRHA